MLTKINEKLDYILNLPRPKRRDVAKMLRKIYKDGFEKGRKLSIKEITKYENS